MLTLAGSAAAGVVYGWLVAHRATTVALSAITAAALAIEVLLIAGVAAAATLAAASGVTIAAHTLLIGRLRRG